MFRSTDLRQLKVRLLFVTCGPCLQNLRFSIRAVGTALDQSGQGCSQWGVQGCGCLQGSHTDVAVCKNSRAVLGAVIACPTPFSKPVWLKTYVDDLGFSKLAIRKLEVEQLVWLSLICSEVQECKAAFTLAKLASAKRKNLSLLIFSPYKVHRSHRTFQFVQIRSTLIFIIVIHSRQP